MGLDILNPVILKAIDTIGGFCLVEESTIDYINYFPVGADKIGVTLYDEPWRYRGQGPTPGLSMHGHVMYNDKMYIFGGDTGNGVLDFSNETWSFDTFTGEWEQLAFGPQKRQSGMMALHGDNIYMAMGRWRDDSSLPAAYYRDLWKYNITNDVWVLLDASIQPTIRGEHRLEVIGDYLYLFGGFVYNGGGGSDTTDKGDTWRYDILNPNTESGKLDGWEAMASLVQPTGRMASAVWNGSIYMSGGYDTAARAWFSRYDPDVGAGTWTALTDTPFRRSKHTLSAYNGKLYMYGGGDETGTAMTELWGYDIALDQWSQLQSGSFATATHAGVMNNSKLYIHDGSTRTRQIWEYTADLGNPWHQKLDIPAYDPGPGARVTASYCMDDDNNMWMFGGTSYTNNVDHVDHPFNELWKFSTESQVWTKLSDNTNWVSYTTASRDRWIYGITGANATQGARSSACMEYFNGKIYVFGGLVRHKTTGGTGGFTPSALLDIYDVVSDTWTHASEPHDSFSLYGATDAKMIIDKRGTGQVYMFGGDRSTDQQRLSQHIKYDIATDTWTELRGIDNTTNQLDGLGRQGHVYELDTSTNRIYVFGGMKTGVASDSNLFRDMYYFDMDDTGTTPWTVIMNGSYPADWPEVRNAMEATIRQDGMLYMLGGWRWNGGAVPDYYTTLAKFDPNTEEWTYFQNVPFQKGGFGMELNDKDDVWITGQTVETWVFRESDTSSTWKAAVKIAKK